MIESPTSSTARKEASPDPSEGRGDKFASILQKLSEKRVKALSSRVRIGTPPLSGRLGGAFCGFFVPLGTLCNLLAVNVCALCA